MLERDNRGIGVDDPAGAGTVGSKRIYKIDVLGATDISSRALPNDGNLAAAVPPIVPVTKLPDVFIDLASNTLLPNGKQVEKWEGITIGPRLNAGDGPLLRGARPRVRAQTEPYSLDAPSPVVLGPTVFP